MAEMNPEIGIGLKEKEIKEKKSDFATLTLESGKDIYREDPDKRNRNRYSLRYRQRRLREAKRPDFKQPQIFNFPRIPKDK